ncbi:hypothetical protein [Pantoea agglomerans]|uniref:hypothetical protein n=1 Tax=Enterobacter agglomerans TaxID=549 RepID=UPI0011B07BF6|nr:hypothetical protein [Pantoea agglomerans]UBN52329.1 hypothetical protein LB453_01835 [Pantoea agglomerans]
MKVTDHLPGLSKLNLQRSVNQASEGYTPGKNLPALALGREITVKGHKAQRIQAADFAAVLSRTKRSLPYNSGHGKKMAVSELAEHAGSCSAGFFSAAIN